MLGQRRGSWVNIKPALVRVFAWLRLVSLAVLFVVRAACAGGTKNRLDDVQRI